MHISEKLGIIAKCFPGIQKEETHGIEIVPTIEQASRYCSDLHNLHMVVLEYIDENSNSDDWTGKFLDALPKEKK